MKRALVLLSIIAACADAEPPPEADGGPAGEEAPAAAAAGDPWAATSSGGVAVRAVPDPDPPALGAVVFTIEADDSTPLSVDLVSPSMPMHGVIRYPLERAANRLVATVEIPMEGDWVLYVNFDEAGAHAAELPFQVDGPAGGGADHAHGAAPAEDPGHEH
ncbi:MAG: hypothetical protein ABFS34_08090 [Gemmatimonadota bacterium]